MEFYFGELDVKVKREMFQFSTGWNSTKDTDGASKKAAKMFQFPTGWNSTDLRQRLDEIGILFQFPTGWNSTSKTKNPTIGSKLFQFPTGWNSTIIHFVSNVKSFVSIPNGMEFYYRRLIRIWIRGVFQFPTGWNST